MHATTFISLLNIIAFASCVPAGSKRASSFPGVATFNDYSSQEKLSGINCGPNFESVPSGLFAAASGDLDPDVKGVSACNQAPVTCNANNTAPWNYQGPSCTQTNCGTCYKVYNTGNFDTSETSQVSTPPSEARSITVRIIDACPSTSAFNYCKKQYDPRVRCGSSSTNSLDIDQGAYEALTGVGYSDGVADLNIVIEPSSCSA